MDGMCRWGLCSEGGGDQGIPGSGQVSSAHWKRMTKWGLMPRHSYPGNPRGTVCPCSDRAPSAVESLFTEGKQSDRTRIKVTRDGQPVGKSVDGSWRYPKIHLARTDIYTLCGLEYHFEARADLPVNCKRCLKMVQANGGAT